MRKVRFILISMLALASLFLAACGAVPAPAAPEAAAEAPPAEEAKVEAPAEEAPAPAAEVPAPTEEVEAQAEATEAPLEEPSADTGDKVEIRWFVGLGTGGNPQQVEAQQKVVDEFNASQDKINLVLEIVENTVAYDQLRTEIASGNPPDIVGPVGVRGANEFKGLWLDLQPLVDKTGYDLAQYDEAAVNFYRDPDEGLTGIPFAVYPALIYINHDLFDEAGLDYPPQKIGEPYADGEPWDIDKMSELALQLTVDENGNDATSPDFDPEKIVQFGFAAQWSAATRLATLFGADSLVDESGNAQMPDHWREAFKWYHDGMWNKHFIPTDAWTNSELLAAGNPFSSGHVAMAYSHLWYTCCIDTKAVPNWDTAAVPSYNSKTTSALHADTFKIMAATKHPDEAFAVLSYLLNEAAPDLLLAYGAMPAQKSAQPDFFASLDEKFSQGVNWDIVTESLGYPDIPSHEAWMPNFGKSDDRMTAFFSELNTDGELDVDKAIDTLVSDLQVLFDEAK